jgi:putative nucleotidyltransferase with HDIG domain
VSLAEALDAKEGYASRHTLAVGELAVSIAIELALEGEELRSVELGALLHDVGKLRIPDSILTKPGPLTTGEWALMRSHAEAGERLLDGVVMRSDVLAVVRSHHERWDGRGYPDGLAGEDIPLGARVVAVADAFQAMTESRPYRIALRRETALREISRMAGSQFDPACVEALLAVVRRHAF